MFESLRKVYTLLDYNLKKKASLSLVLALFGMLLEVASMGSLLPFISFLISPDRITSLPFVQEWFPSISAYDPLHILALGGVGIVLLFVLKALFFRKFILFNYTFTEAVKYSISLKLMTKYIRSPYTFHIERSTPKILRSVGTDTNGLQAFVSMFLTLSVNLLTILGICTMLVASDPILYPIMFALLTLTVYGIILYSKRGLGALGGRVRSLEGKVSKSILSGLGGIKETKVLNREEGFIEEFSTHAKNIGISRALINLRTSLNRYLLELATVMLTVGVVILVSVFSEQSGEDISIKMSMFGASMIKILPSLNFISTALPSFRSYKPTIDALYSELHHWNSEEATSFSTDRIVFNHALHIKNICFQYPNSEGDVLKNLSLRIPKNKSVGFVGSSGAGKTTIIDILLGLISPYKGDVFIDDTPLDTENTRKWQNIVGYIPQSIFLSDVSIKGNIAFGLKPDEISDDRVLESLKAAQLYDFVMALPDGVNTLIGEGGVKLSGGQRQRIGIARALYTRPEVLIMDEATASLDNRTEKAFSSSIKHLSGQKTIVIVAHRLTTVKNCDIIYVIKEGQLVSSGTYDDLEKNDPHFQELIV